MKKDPKKIISFGLLPLPVDHRDFSHDVVFGGVAKDELPEGDFFVSEPLEIKDQGNTDFCAGYAGAAVSEDQEGVLLNPEYTWAQAKKLLGPDEWQKWGINLRDYCQAAKKKGFLEQEHFPFIDRDRDFLANPANWSEELDLLAFDHRKNSFFKVDGPYDTFDNFRAVLKKNAASRRSILTGALWRNSWTMADGGIIPSTYEEGGTGHAFKVFGQMEMINPETMSKELYLVAQLSNGQEIGDKGIFYFSRAVVNKEFVFGAFTFEDMPAAKAKTCSEYGFKHDANPFYKLFKLIRGMVAGIKK